MTDSIETNGHELRVAALRSVCGRYFAGRTDAQAVSDMCHRLMDSGRMTAEEVADIVADFVHMYAESIERPYLSDHIEIVSAFVSGCDLDYELIDRDGVLTSFATKLIRHFTAEYFMDRLPLHNALSRCRRVLDAIPTPSEAVDMAMLTVIDKAIKRYLSAGPIADERACMIWAFVDAACLDITNLPERFKPSFAQMPCGPR